MGYLDTVIISESAIITEKPCLFWGLNMYTSADSSTVNVYNGVSDKGGKKIAFFAWYYTANSVYILPKPILCDKGLYIELVADNKDVTVFYEQPVPQESEQVINE